MTRLGASERAAITTMYSAGLSLNEISFRLQVPKSTIYYHTRLQFGRKQLPLSINSYPTRDLGELLGLFAADGCFYHDARRYGYILLITLSRNQLSYARRMARITAKVLGRAPRIYSNRNALTLVTRGKAILPFLRRYMAWEGRKTHTIRFKSGVFTLGKPFLQGIARGLVAGDGGVYGPKRRVAFGVVSKRLALQYRSILSLFGIPSHLYPVDYAGKRTLYHVHVTGRASLRLFNERIGLTDPTKQLQLSQALRP